jgi:hypothetical protein
MKRFLALVAGALVVAAIAAVPAGASRRETGRALAWQRVCENVAKGEVSQQPALVCIHRALPVWSSDTVARLQQFCQLRLGGTFVYRAELPAELGACFFD